MARSSLVVAFASAFALIGVLPAVHAQGGLGYPCFGNDDLCTDGSYCTDASARPTAQNICGGTGSFCDSNANCASGYCSPFTAECAANPNAGTPTTTPVATTTTTSSAAATTTAASGGLGAPCYSNDANCRNGVSCLDANYDTTLSNTCGGNGAFCQDPDMDESVWNSLCVSGYCDQRTAQCADYPSPPAPEEPEGPPSCLDPAYACTPPGVCNADTGSCTYSVPATTPTTSAGQTTAPPTASTPFVVSGSVSTTRLIAQPASVSCASSAVYTGCLGGADRSRTCCTSDVATCAAIYGANVDNCDEVGNAYYPCSSTSSADVEECCETIFAAYFGAGGGEDEACVV
ncbi:hypothetical protein JCM8547_004235 [Rhodosporidiobolus lusitaniae]